MGEQHMKPLRGVTFTTERSYISVLYTGEHLVLDFPQDKHISDIIKFQIKGARFNELGNKKWVLPKDASPRLQEVMPPKYLSFKTQEQIKRDAKFLAFQEESLLDVLERIPKDIDSSFMKLPPKNFQKVTIGWVATRKGKRGNVYGGLLGDDMGLGKTIQALASAAYLKQQGKIKRCLIVTEAGLKDQWSEETQRFTNESFIVIEGKGKKDPVAHRRAQLREVKEKDIFFTITNYDLLHQREVIGEEIVQQGKKTIKKQIKGDYIDLPLILENEYDMIILDEAQKIRNIDTVFCKAVYQIQHPTYRLIMTGTPIEKEIEHLFPLIDYLSPDIFADSSLDIKERLRLFEDKFLIKTLNKYALPKRVPEATGVKNLEILNKLLSPFMLRRELNDVKDELPRALVDVEVLPWEEHQEEFYQQVAEELVNKNEEWGEVYGKENEIFAQLEHGKEHRKRHDQLKSRYYATKKERSLLEKEENKGADWEEICRNENELLAELEHSQKLLNRYEQLENMYYAVNKQRVMLENEVKALRLYTLEICDTPELLLRSPSPIAHRLIAKNEFFSKIHKKAKRIMNNSSLSEKEKEEKLDTLFEEEVPTVPKLKRLVDTIEKLGAYNDIKSVTFTRFETMSRIIERKVKLRFLHHVDKDTEEPLHKVVMYTGKTKSGCQLKTHLKKKGTPNENPPCHGCPFLEKCNTRRKSKWHLQEDPATKLLVATDAANAGVNLQSAQYNINYDLPDSPSKYAQRNGRVRRIGSKHEVVYFLNLVTKGGIDEFKFTKIQRKQANIDIAIHQSDEQKQAVADKALEMDALSTDNDDVDLHDEQDLIKQIAQAKKKK